MPRWEDVERDAPDLAARVKRVFDANKHKTMATLRKDGSPRISGTELDFFGGDVYLGSMLGAMKARDLQRDPRVAFHSATVDTELTDGDAKISGRAVEITDPERVRAFVAARSDASAEIPDEEFHLFTVDVDELVLTTIGDPPDHLVIEHWRDGRGTTRVERK